MSRFKNWLFPPVSANELVRRDMRSMLPGMLIEQVAATLLDNINIVVMGFIGSEATAGVSQVSTINNTMMIVVQFFAMGGTALVAQAAGAGNAREGRRVAGDALALGTALSLAAALLLFCLRVPLIKLMFGAADDAVISNSLAYYGFTSLAPPLWFIYFQCCGFMRSCGDTRRPMAVSIATNALSILLNLLLTFELGLGIRGSAMSYLFSVAGGAAIALALVARRGFAMRPCFRLDATTTPRMRSIASIGLPSSIENFMFNGTKLVIQVFVAGMGTTVIAANQVFNSASNVMLIPFMSINYLTTPVVGRCAGREGVNGLADCLEYLHGRAHTVAIFTGLAHIVLAFPMALIFSRDAETVRLAVRMLVIYALFSPFMPGCFIYPNGFKAVGDAKYPMYYSTVSAWFVRVCGTWLLGVVLGWGTLAIVLTQGLDHISRCTAYTRRFKSGKWLDNFKRIHSEEDG